MHKKPQLSRSFQVFMKESPQHAKVWVEAVKGLGHACALEPRTRELAYIGILAALGMESGMDYHVIKAKGAGATREEIKSAVLLGLPAAGNVVVQSLPAALEAYDQK